MIYELRPNWSSHVPPVPPTRACYELGCVQGAKVKLRNPAHMLLLEAQNGGESLSWCVQYGALYTVWHAAQIYCTLHGQGNVRMSQQTCIKGRRKGK